jgi:hypothetical protein
MSAAYSAVRFGLDGNEHEIDLRSRVERTLMPLSTRLTIGQAR